MPRNRLIIISISGLIALWATAARAQHMYWTDTVARTISRANIDGTNRQTIISSGLTGPRGITLDLEDGKIYWTDEGRNVVERSNLNGTGREVLVGGLHGPRGIALDKAAGKMYWVDRLADRVQRSDLDGQNVETLIGTGLTDPLQIALDLPSGYLYVTDTESPGSQDGRILRAGLDGSGLITLVGGLGDPIGIALDLNAGKMYWNDSAARTIRRANLDGSSVETLVSSGLVYALGLALDLQGGKIYWTDSVTVDSTTADARIQRSNLNGTNVETLINTGLFNPRDIALDLSCVGVPDNSPCNDGHPCTGNDRCVAGSCTGVLTNGPCDDANPCTSNDMCTAGVCGGVPITGTCNDGNPCTEGDVCVQGVCLGTPSPALCTGFSLMVTEVNGVPCPSCPTANLPETEVRPGDAITIEAFLSGWNPDAHGNPMVGAFQWTINSSGYQSGDGGFLAAAGPSCGVHADCHGGFSASECSCAESQCLGGQCDAHSIAFLDFTRSDYLFAQYEHLPVVRVLEPFAWGGAILVPDGGVPDPGSRAYVGTLILKASLDARGRFVVSMLTGDDWTFVLDQDAFLLRSTLFPVVINFCDVLTSPNDCNGNDIPDECERDGDGDGVIDACDPCPIDNPDDTDDDGVCNSSDGCPNDPNKASPGACGCGVSETGDADGDGVADCNDECPGVDDALFAPECVDAIPVVSQWGVIILSLLLLTAAKVLYRAGKTRLRSG